MSKQLYQSMKAILAMPYFKNEQARSGNSDRGHEAAVAAQLDHHGFQLLLNRDYPKLKKQVMKEWEQSGFDPHLLAAMSDTSWERKPNRTFGLMPNGSYLMQPAGAQSFPDFLIRDFNARFIAVEAKSGKKKEGQSPSHTNSTAAPMWNDNLPKLGAIYIYSNEKVNETTLFLGRDVITPQVIQLQQQLINQLSTVVDTFRSRVTAADVKSRGWDIKFRPQNFQGGGAICCDYFKHKDRVMCEKNVMEFAKQ